MQRETRLYLGKTDEGFAIYEDSDIDGTYKYNTERIPKREDKPVHDITIALYQRNELARQADEIRALQMAVGALGLALAVVVGVLIYIL